MEVLFSCPSCKQQLEADSTMAGTSINCPSCGASISIPEADPANLRVANAPTNAEAKEHRNFSVPVHDAPAESLIQKPNKPLEVAAREGAKQLRIKCIKRTECVEVGADHFDETVTKFLEKIGETNLVSITPIGYSHLELGSRALLNDYGVMIVYRG